MINKSIYLIEAYGILGHTRFNQIVNQLKYADGGWTVNDVKKVLNFPELYDSHKIALIKEYITAKEL